MPQGIYFFESAKVVSKSTCNPCYCCMQTSTLSLGHFFITLKEIVFILPPNFPIVMLRYFNGNMFNDKSKDAQNPILLMSNTR